MSVAAQKVESLIRNETSLSIRVARTAAEREAIYRLRYEIYVEEMHRLQPHADHARRRIEEPADKTAILLGAWDSGELVGTLRINLTRDSKIEYPEIYDLDAYESIFPKKTALLTKLMIKQNRRGGRICLNIFRETYKVLRTEGALAIVIDANDHLLSLYQRIGFRPIKEKVSHPIYGLVTPMVMFLRDQMYFNEIRSPLADLCRFYNGMEALSLTSDVPAYGTANLLAA